MGKLIEAAKKLAGKVQERRNKLVLHPNVAIEVKNSDGSEYLKVPNKVSNKALRKLRAALDKGNIPQRQELPGTELVWTYQKTAPRKNEGALSLDVFYGLQKA